MADENLVDPLDEPGGTDPLEGNLPGKTAPEVEKPDEDLVDATAEPSDGLDIEHVDEFEVSDFDEDFDDDFEEENEGEYDILDDQYGEEFDRDFGHLTDPTREAPKKAAAESKKKK